MKHDIETLEKRCRELIDTNFDMVFAEDPILKRIVIIGELKILTEKKFDKMNLATINTTMAQVREELTQRLFDYIFADLIKQIKNE